MVNTYALKRTLSHLATPYFLLNTLSSLLHPLLRFTPGICDFLAEDCNLNYYELEIYFFVLCVVVIKNRRCVSIESYLTTMFLFAKAGSTILFFKMNIQLSIWYILVNIVLMVTLRAPFLEDSSEMKYFVDRTLPEHLKEDKHTIWIVEFYSTFSPHCNAVKPIFGALSREFTHEHLKFGKCDVLKAEGLAETFGISASCFKTELPAIIVFESGKPVVQVQQTIKGKQYRMTYDNLKRDLRLQEFYEKAIDKTKKMKSNKKKQ